MMKIIELRDQVELPATVNAEGEVLTTALHNSFVIHEFTHEGNKPVALLPVHMDVTSRTDGPFIGKIYDADTDTFTALPPPPEEL